MAQYQVRKGYRKHKQLIAIYCYVLPVPTGEVQASELNLSEI